MKAKVVGLLVVALHMVVLAGFSLMQGCATGGGSSFHWPFTTPKDTPAVLPADDLTSGGILLPVVSNAPAITVPSATKVYSVQKGDTLSSIASVYGTSWKKLAEYNNLSNPNQLKVGQELRISELSGAAAPLASVKHAAPVSSRPVASSIKPGTYVIKKGDLLSTIAKRSGLTIAEIKAANSLTTDSIVAGKSLTIPKKGAAVKATSAAAKPVAAKAANPVPAKAVSTNAPAMPAPAPLADAAPAAAVSTGAVSAAAAPAVPAAAPVAKAASAPVYEHVLYPGETLDDVARQYGSSQQEIMKLNNITDSASVKPGTKLLVPIPE